MTGLTIRALEGNDLDKLAAAVRDLGGDKPRSQYERYLAEQRDGRRTVPIAALEDIMAGYVTVNWNPSYPPFERDGIPEIQDFNVLPRFRRRGIGTRLMDGAEDTVSRRLDIVGIGVGLSADYGPALRLYVLRGYVPDGRGLCSYGRTVPRGAAVKLDDGLAIYMTRDLRRGAPC